MQSDSYTCILVYVMSVDKEFRTQKFLSKVLFVCTNYHAEDDLLYFENDKPVSGVFSHVLRVKYNANRCDVGITIRNCGIRFFEKSFLQTVYFMHSDSRHRNSNFSSTKIYTEL